MEMEAGGWESHEMKRKEVGAHFATLGMIAVGARNESETSGQLQSDQGAKSDENESDISPNTGIHTSHASNWFGVSHALLEYLHEFMHPDYASTSIPSVPPGPSPTATGTGSFAP